MNNKSIRIEYQDGERPAVLTRKPKKYLKNLKTGYVRVFQDCLVELGKDKDLSGDDLRVFLGILANLEYENIFRDSLTKLASDINMNRVNVSRCVSKLVKKRYLVKVGSQGKVNHYMVDPRMLFRTRAEHLTDLFDVWDEVKR